ncbi:MAG: hypothetical protein ACI9RU_001103 [Litorivivens sp.]|jgi:hypothetical protein
MLSATVKISCLIILICSACLINAQFKAEIMLLPQTHLNEVKFSEQSNNIIFEEESLSANGSIEIESTSPAEILIFLQHEPRVGLVKTFFSLSKFPELQESFRAVSYDLRKSELILEQQENGTNTE